MGEEGDRVQGEHGDSLLSALKQHCFPMAEANGFPSLPAVQCSELTLGSDQTQFTMEPWHLGKPW